MTTIVAYHDKASGEVWIGGDTRSTTEDFIWPVVVRKWVAVGLWRIGVSGSAMTIQVLRAHVAAGAELATPEAVAAWVMGLLREAGFQNTQKPDEHGTPNYGQDLLLASKDGVWAINGDGFVSEPEWGFFAAGSGADYAYPAARAFLMIPQDRGRPEQAEFVLATLTIASLFDTSTGGDFIVERVE